jgi:DNA-binding GntR family transcriptional regulator
MGSTFKAKKRKLRPAKRGPIARPSSEPASGEPLYVQIERTLKQQIVSGIYPVGAPFPTEDELTEHFSVSRHTVREALRRLREAGLISSRRGVGTVVEAPRPSGSYHVTSIEDLLSFAAAAAGRFEAKSIQMVRVDEEWAERTGLKIGEERLAVSGLAYTKGDLPFCWNEYYIHRDFAAVGRLLHHHKSSPVFPLIEDMFGLKIVTVEQEISATLITPELAKGLNVEPGTAALQVRRTYLTKDGRVAQVSVNTHPAALFRHSMTMHRVRQ